MYERFSWEFKISEIIRFHPQEEEKK